MHEPTLFVEPDDMLFYNRRCFPRRTPRGTGMLLTDDKESPAVPIVMRNISRGGISFVVDRRLEVGERITIRLKSLALLKPLTLQAEVRWIGRDVKPGEFRVGCSWTERLLYAHIIHFV